MSGMTGIGSAVPAGAPNTAAPAPAPAPESAPARSACSCNAPAGGGPEQARAAADALGGGTDVMIGLAQALEGLSAAVKQLAEVVSRMQANGQVAGMRGAEASTEQFVASLQGPVVSGGGEDDEFEQRVLDLVNAEREKAGLRPLIYNPLLDQAAGGHAEHMSRVGQMAHEGIGDGTPGDRIRATGFRSAWGENVAMGQRTPEQVVAEWMASPTHRENILDPNFRQLGVEHRVAADGTPFWAQAFGA